MSDLRITQGQSLQAIAVGLKPVPSAVAQTVKAAGDQARTPTVSNGIPATTQDSRRERATEMALAMLNPAADDRKGITRWTTPDADQKTQVSRGLRLAADLQDPRLLPTVARIAQAGGPNAADANDVVRQLVAFADTATLTAAQHSLQPEAATSAPSKAITDGLAQRQAGVQATKPELSGAAIHWREAGRGVIDFAKDITVGTARQIAHDPLHFPTQMVVGMGTSLHNAFTNTGGAVVGLMTAGAHGSFGGQMTAELANTGMWASGFAKGRKTDMHKNFAETQKLSEGGFAREMGAWPEVHRNPVVAARVAKAMSLPTPVAGTLSKLESGVRNRINVAKYGTELIYEGTKPTKRAGTVWKDMGWEPTRVAKNHTLGTESSAVTALFDTKWKEFKIIDKAMPGAMPETHLAVNLIKELGLKIPKDKKGQAKFLGDLQTKLNERFPEGYFIKGNADWNTGGNLPTAKTPFKKTFEGYHREFVPLEKKLRKEQGELADLQPTLRTHEFHAGRTLNDLLKDPTSVVIQPRLELKRWTKKELPRHIQPFQEFRVHVVRGQVVPGASSHRWNLMSTFTERKAMAKAEAFVQTVMDKMPNSIKMRSALAPDVVQLANGGFKVLEVNPGGASGFLHRNPLAAHKLVEAVTGRETTPLYIARRLGIGAVAATTVATHQPPMHGEDK